MANKSEFEKWISRPPYEKSTEKNPTGEPVNWPGQYKDYEVQLAWEVWQEVGRRSTEYIETLKAKRDAFKKMYSEVQMKRQLEIDILRSENKKLRKQLSRFRSQIESIKKLTPADSQIPDRYWKIDD